MQPRAAQGIAKDGNVVDEDGVPCWSGKWGIFRGPILGLIPVLMDAQRRLKVRKDGHDGQAERGDDRNAGS